MATLASTQRTQLRRKRERGAFERDVADAILDEALACHVGFAADHGPVVLPMVHARVDDELYLHGAAGNAMLRGLGAGTSACITVTILDGLVFARAAFHHSVNYRCVVLFGTLRLVTEFDEKRRFSAALVDRLAAGRSGDARPPTDEELRATTVVAMAIDEGSVKVRRGGPVDADADVDLPIWAGTVPLALVAGTPIAATDGTRVALPRYLDGDITASSR